MAAELSITSIFEITGLYTGNETLIDKFTSTSVPIEVVKGSPVTGITETSIDLGDIAAGKGFSLYLEAITGNFYIKLGATTGIPVNTDSQIYLLEGEHCVIPINPDSTAMPGVRFIGDDASSQLLYVLVGKA